MVTDQTLGDDVEQSPSDPARPGWQEWVVRTGAAAAAGIAMWSAFPPRNLWFMAVISVGVLAAVLSAGHPRARTGTWAGFVFGLGFFLPLLPWIGVYVGPLPWVALAIVMSGFTALFGAIATVSMRLPCPPIWFTLSWVLVEAFRSRFPFGGFPWGRAAFSQADGPLLPVASILGAPGLSAAVALFGASAAWVVMLIVARATGRDELSVPRAALAVVLTMLAPIVAIAVTPTTLDQNVSAASTKVAVVQGNVPRLGLDFNAQRRAVLDNHVKQTMRLAESIAHGHTEQPDIVLWPENASDISPFTNSDAAAEITAASEAVGAPIMVGTLVRNPDGRPTNTVLVWDQDQGPVDRYDKHIIQPFGEYLPWRGFFRMFSSYADMAGDFEPGSGPAALAVPGRSGSVMVGISTCWEVAFDSSARTAVDDGAQLLYVPTNNATFGRTEMTYQQLAMSQVRAVEHGRAVAVAATSGVSAIIEPDGSIASSTQIFAPGMLTARLPLHTEKTLATRLGGWPELVAAIVALFGFLFAVARHTRFTLGLRKVTIPPRNGTEPGNRPASEDTRHEENDDNRA